LFIRFLLIISLTFSPLCPSAIAQDPLHRETPDAESTGLVTWLLAKDKPMRRGFTRVRIALLATDDELVHLSQVRQEVEHALEPPTTTEAFWARKWETLKNPQYALDITRSFKNMARLIRVSRDFPSAWVRDFLACAITMFSITHGSEMVAGLVGAAYSLAHGNFVATGAWLGFALPGLYDFGCYIGAGVLFIRPTRNGFNTGRKIAFSLSGGVVQKLGLPAAMDAVLGHAGAREKLLELVHQPNAEQRLELEIADSELLHLRLLNEQGAEFAVLNLRETSTGELALDSAVITASQVPGERTGLGRWMPNFELRRIVYGLGWNVGGAVLTLARLIRSDRTHLIEHEKTFVDSAQVDGDTIHIQFRPGAVAFSTFRPSPVPSGCPQTVLNAMPPHQL
jgi:hypothetical protein